MEYLALAFFFLVLWWNFIYIVNSRKRRKKEKERENRIPTAFEINKNHFPMYDSYDISVSDFIENGGFMQLHCQVAQNGELIRGFCSKDFTSFEVEMRHEMFAALKRLGDDSRDQAIKIWYKNADGSDFSDTNDIPLGIIITFYKPKNMDDTFKKMIKECIYSHLQKLVRIDWNEVNAALHDLQNGESSLTTTALDKIINSYSEEIGVLYSTRNVCRHLRMDMNFFYENEWFYGGRGVVGDGIYEKLKEKYPQIEDCYLKSLSSEYIKDTIF